MKRMLFLAFLASSLCAQAQNFTLPYNPDENADGLIGVADLQGLLAQYGSEFSAAVVSEDGEDAIVFMGNMAYPLCAQSCKNLPGMWTLPTMEDLGLVWNEVYTTSTTVYTWMKSSHSNVHQGLTNNEGVVKAYDYFWSNSSTSATQHIHQQTDHPSYNYGCYCAARQMPRVEYTYCEGTDIQECANLKVQDGWYPLNGITKISYNGQNKIQAFWRWAE
jgi:hypothetical protein